MATVRPYGPITAGLPNDGSLVGLVRGWANRDERALPDQIIMDAIRYSTDKAYRHLRIPPLEHTVRYTADQLQAATIGEGNVYQSVTALTVPSDLIEFIQIRGTDVNGLTTRVFNEKSDIRSYWDRYNVHYNEGAYWSRQGDQILISPGFGQVASGYYGGFTAPEACIEIYYYRRLPALNATFSVTADNANLGAFANNDLGVSNGVLTHVAASTPNSQGLWYDMSTLVPITETIPPIAGSNNFFTTHTVNGGVTGITNLIRRRNNADEVLTYNPNQLTPPTDGQYNTFTHTNGTLEIVVNEPLASDVYLVTYNYPTATLVGETAYDEDNGSRTEFFFTGNSVPNWFKDENERIVLYGALAEIFAYLQEDDQAGKYTQLMMKEIEDLNEEDRARDASGGNVQMQYNARGLI